MKIKYKIDWLVTLIPFVLIILLTLFLFIVPEEANEIISKIRFFFVDSLGVSYLALGILVFGISLFLSVSKYGEIVLGDVNEKPKYSFFSWGSMMFTCGLAADIVFYSFCEWVLYSDNPYIFGIGSFDEWVGVFPLFHWSFIPWSFYLVLAVAFGFMIHVDKRNRRCFSEACRGVIGKHADGMLGKIIDLFALFALLAGTATTFSVATPLMAEMLMKIFNISLDRTIVTIIIIIITCIVYILAILHKFKGINKLAKICIYMFYGLLIYVLFFGGQGKFIIENGFQSFGKMIQNFIGLATYVDPGRNTFFPQEWTVFYWAYWLVWCIVTPFFIGNISRGRTIRQTIIGGYIFGVGSTIVSFVVLGNHSLGLQVKGSVDFIEIYAQTSDPYALIQDIISTLPCSTLISIWILILMITFYATSFDSIAYTAACYSYKKLEENEHPDIIIQLLWCVLLIVLPIGLIFSESSMNNIQSVSIVLAFPIGIIMILIIVSFFKALNLYVRQ